MDATDHGAVKNLEQIQESDDAGQMPRAVSLVLVGLGAAALAFAVLAIGGRKTATNEKRPDPLGDLVAQHAGGSGGGVRAPSGANDRPPSLPMPAAAVGTPSAAAQLSARDVTFPSILSDDKNGSSTTALAAVRSPVSAPPPPAPSERLPVVQFAGGTPPVPHDTRIEIHESAPPPAPAPRESHAEISFSQPSAPSLPAQNVLEATPIVTRPRDALTKTASDAAQIATPPAASSPQGHEGGWQLQVSSFKTEQEASQFADQLRARGHKAYTVQARVPGRGEWWRVRVGPFASQHAALAYRASFEQKEHVVPFVVPPKDRTKPE
jgi:cell division septation protein DedD